LGLYLLILKSKFDYYGWDGYFLILYKYMILLRIVLNLKQLTFKKIAGIIGRFVIKEDNIDEKG